MKNREIIAWIIAGIFFILFLMAAFQASPDENKKIEELELIKINRNLQRELCTKVQIMSLYQLEDFEKEKECKKLNLWVKQ